MKVINPISLARQALSSSSAAEREEEQRVLQLFRNRAELKKAYTELQDEIHRLKDRLKQQEGATARVQELLGDLESRLGLSETAYPVLVFYQLRRLWNTGTEMLRTFAADLERQHTERERRLFLAEANRQQFEQRQQIEAALREAELEAAEAAQQAVRLERERRELNRPWHHFKRRALEEQMAAAATLRLLTDSRLAAVREQFEAAQTNGDLSFPGLSLAARRRVNVAIVAYAEILCQRLAGTPLLALARATVLRRDAADEYGGRADCEAMMAEIARGLALLGQRVDVGAELRQRAERLERNVRYRAADDAVPVPESTTQSAGDVLARPAQGARTPPLPNVLAEDLWDVYRVLLR
ncbi:MAG: hypothetical protein H7A14_03970 [Sinobacteraceae bacterium]|nr:hypothetical protein [Nevskiaceae bacterium]